ncbi:hypothetical protein CLAIMM_00508 [Cladophialophora immunda]|nr:hypothetical protein CLAIMM_00508 [Cladophialophora immunda]
MSTIDVPPANYPPEITGYVEPWIADPGDTIQVKGVDVPHSPKKELEEVAVPSGVATGRFQLARIGSYALVEHWCRLPPQHGLSLSMYFQPWLTDAGHLQSMVSTLDVPSKSGFGLFINTDGAVELWAGTGSSIEVFLTTFKPSRKRWVHAKLDIKGMRVSLYLEPVPHAVEKRTSAMHYEASLPHDFNISPDCALLFAGTFAESVSVQSPRATHFFNGRIDSPSITAVGPEGRVIVQYDFARNISGDSIIDTSGGGHHGLLINAPTRGVRGYNWDASEIDWTKAKYGYGAIHFHEDDLDDAKWETDLTVALPSDLRSGIYASKSSPRMISAGPWETQDPNRPSSNATGAALCESTPYSSEDMNRQLRRWDIGLSTYDTHNDLSGTVFSTAKRPITNFRPGFISYGLARPRHLSAESMMIGYLERENIPYETITDHDLHQYGASALTPYNTVITGGHPEYLSFEIYDAYENYAKRGGNLMYLGGNGFYWVTALDPARPWRVEVRRGEEGVRSYSMEPGERHLSLDGRYGTLWRARGRSSHALFGVAFCSQGRPPGVPYKRTEAGKDARFSWMFDGMSDGELIGVFGLGGGASGDEMDSFDLAQGSPRNAVVVATSTGHPDGFGIASECVAYPILATRGTETNEIRSDMVYYETDGGGAVFSVGSINWYPSLGWDDYRNNVARLTGNVIREFFRREQTKP